MFLYDVEVKKESKFVVCIQANGEEQAISGIKRMLEAGDIYFDPEDEQGVQFAVKDTRKAPVEHWLLSYR